MKLNRKNLTDLIKEALTDRESKVLKSPVNEATQWSQYQRIMDLFTGEVGSVDQIVIMSPMNPHAKKIPDEQNKLRKQAFEEDLKRAGFGYRFIEGKYGSPEDSYIIPHMSQKEATYYSYRYAQESFVYSVRQDPAPSPEDKILHMLCYVNFKEKEQDPNYSVEEYGLMYIVPESASFKVGEQTTDMSDFATMAGADDYYSAVPKKQYKDPKTGKLVTKSGDKFSMDFDFEKGKKGNITSPMASPKNPKFPRSMKETYVSVREADVPNLKEAKELVETINERCRKINEKNRVGSSRWRERKRLIGDKNKLIELIKRHK